ncbi:MAG: MBOAT family protein [Myxococcota bacterium]
MLFHTPVFGFFLFACVAVAWALANRPRARLGFLLVASYVFYAAWEPRFVVLMAGCAVLDWAGALVVARQPTARRRRVAVAVVAGVHLGLLGFWKYTDFILQALEPWLAEGGAAVGPSGILLPVGISFFTFQGIGYVVDVGRGQVRAETALWRVMLFLAFFPQLIAGPIVRADRLLPQLGGQGHPAPRLRLPDEDFSRGLSLLIVGLLKKTVLADVLAREIVDRVFDLPQMYTGPEVLVAVYGYALQIYGDFSGYSDMAVGMAVMFGISIPRNFDRPYRAASLQEFWRRWHITLSQWLRDYLYIPLGGNRGGRWARDRNLLITMVLGGLWHGAAWTFVAWGTLHGFGLVVERRFGRPARAGWRRAIRVLVTFHLVCFAWIWFRAPSFDLGADVVRQLWTGGWDAAPNLNATMAVVLALGALEQAWPREWGRRVAQGFVRAPALAQAAVLVVALRLVATLDQGGSSPFIYFQF